MADKRPNVFPKTQAPQPTAQTAPQPSVEQSLLDIPIPDDLTEEQRLATEEMIRRTQEQLAERNKALAKQNAPQKETPQPLTLKKSMTDKYYEPKWGAPYDLIPIPSEGKLYPNVGDKIKVSFISGSDENILTSPNLIQSGEFMKILIGRNLLEKNLTYEDLHTGDRNAIMLFLRCTAFGYDYNITVFDDEGKEHNITYDLSEIKYKKLGDTPNEAGLFTFKCPISEDLIEFKFLTCGDEDFIAKMEDEANKNGEMVNGTATFMLQRMIIGVNGNYDSDFVDDYIENKMKIMDIRAFRNHVDNIQSGVDLEIEVSLGGGKTTKTFLPLNYTFFWPEL
jgi:hypothetical protein